MSVDVSAILDKYRDATPVGGTGSEALIAILQDVQERFNYLPPESLQETARFLEIPISQVYAVATFYNAFSLEPKGKHVIQVCMGTACHVRGAPRIVEELERLLDTERGTTSADGEFTLETVNCLGACALGPVMVVDGTYHGNLTTNKLSRVLDQYRGATE